MKKLLLFAIFLFSINSCTVFWPYKSDYQCPLDEGQKCKSLKEINEMVDNEEI